MTVLEFLRDLPGARLFWFGILFIVFTAICGTTLASIITSVSKIFWKRKKNEISRDNVDSKDNG